ncbi:MAG: pantoate--beta-alanine ligase [Planctomycetota bacterium]|nr:pantoate--beta-alanine ligase [Planctomycetota bacterium]
MVELIHDPAAMRERVLAARMAGRRIGFVPTMGALHAGHMSLVEQAAHDCDDVVVSIFVNPTQFGPHEDFERYPRTLEADCRLLEAQRIRWIFAPDRVAMYPPGDATRVVVAGPAEPFEGTIRPGHFTGVATVVLKLFQMVPAHAAYFGAKDWQQTRVVMQMVRDLAVPIRIVVCPTIRESDGLAMSSRNAYLSASERAQAVALVQCLGRAEDLWRAAVDVTEIELAMQETLKRQGIAVDYSAIVDAESLTPLRPTSDAVALVAGRAGMTRLIDNRLLPAR